VLILRLRNTICSLGVLFMILYHCAMIVFPPPDRYPDLYWAANNAFSFLVFALMSLYAHCRMHENKS
jgi:hypothetical protein